MYSVIYIFYRTIQSNYNYFLARRILLRGLLLCLRVFLPPMIEQLSDPGIQLLGKTGLYSSTIGQELNISFKQYIVIHVRCGDSYLKQENSEFKTKYLFKLVNSIKEDINNINNDNNTYLLISDNNEIKFIILWKSSPF
jgi:hypothetical protein